MIESGFGLTSEEDGKALTAVNHPRSAVSGL
jgi:hypothetical protein